MHPHRRRKKRPNYGIRTVEVERGPNGFGFTISGQQPCILSCIVANSPADQAGLRAGDFLISVNGLSVSKITHDAVVQLIGNSVGPIKMSIAEYYYSDSSDEELETGRILNNRKPKYMHKPRTNRSHHKTEIVNSVEVSGKMKKETSPKKAVKIQEFKKVTVSQENVPSTSQIKQIQEINPIEYKAFVGYLGTIEMPKQLLPNSRLQTVCSCIRKLRQEKRTPTAVLMTVQPSCLTLKNSHSQVLAIFPANRVVYISSSSDKESRYFGLVTSAVNENNFETPYLWQNYPKMQEKSAEIEISNSCHVFVTDPKLIDHGAHLKKAENFKFTCTQDIITGCCLEFPKSALYIVSLVQNMYRLQDGPQNQKQARLNEENLVANSPQPSASSNSDSGIGFRDDCGNISDRILVVEFPAQRTLPPFAAQTNRPLAIDGSSIPIEQFAQENMFRKPRKPEIEDSKKNLRNGDVDTGQIFTERPVDVPDTSYFENSFLSNDELKGSIDNISVHSSKSFDLTVIKTIFKTPKYYEVKKKRAGTNDYKLSPKTYGIKPNYSCEELNNLETFSGFKDLCSAVSEPDVRIQRDAKYRLEEMMCENATPMQNSNSSGAGSWAGSFENLLNDPLGVQIFAEFLKKEFSAENIYFWTACERFKRLNGNAERASEAQRIYRRHLCVGAPEPVNVDSQGRQYSQQALQDAESKLFEQAQKQIFNLMKFDSYPRFIKSDLYKQCLTGSIDYPSLEVGLLIHPPTGTPTKLKKSLSNAEDRRRKSLLPWHRKNRSKSKDRGETEYNQRKDGAESMSSASGKNGTTAQNTHSSQSSLTSLDLAMSCSMQDCSSSKGSQDDMTPCNAASTKAALCRVILNDGATTVVQIRPTETVRQLANRLLDKRGLNYSAYEVHVAGLSKPIDLNEMSASLSGCEVIIEQRVVFKLDLPNRKVISVKSKTTKILLDVLRPILHKYGYVLDGLHVTVVGNNEVVDVNLPVTSVDGRRLNIQLSEEPKIVASSQQIKPSQQQDEVTNKVFKKILHEKPEPPNRLDACDRGSVKSDDWGSDHSSGIFGFMRRESTMHEKKKRMNIFKTKGNSTNSSVEDVTGEQATKKPLIAILKTGVKLQIAATSESDGSFSELYEGLKRAQRRFDDQRGTEINFELPEFLKDKENASTQQSNKMRKIQQNGIANGETCRFYDNDVVVTKQVTEKLSPPVATTRNLKKLELKNTSNEVKSLPSTPSNKGFSSLENSMVEQDTTLKVSSPGSPKSVEPPPLPPKPKVLPIKPSNWGANNCYKVPREATPKPAERTKQTLYLEQTTSSFV